MVGARNGRCLRPVELRREKQKESRRQNRKRHGAVGLEHLDRLVAEDRHRDADRRDENHERQRRPSISAAEELGARLRGDHAVDREPTDREEQGERRAKV